MLWGKIKYNTVVELFGDLRQVAASVPLPRPPAPSVPALRVPATTVSVDELIHTEVGLPAIDFDIFVDKLQVIALRDWKPAGPSVDMHDMSYLALGDVDVVEPLEVVERIGEASS
jgi:hypothetical protein